MRIFNILIEILQNTLGYRELQRLYNFEHLFVQRQQQITKNDNGISKLNKEKLEQLNYDKEFKYFIQG